MNKLGFKVANNLKEKKEVLFIIEFVAKNKTPLEIIILKENADWLFKKIILNNIPITYHMGYENKWITNYEEKENFTEQLMTDIHQIPLSVDVKGVVLHLIRYAPPTNPKAINYIIENAIKNLNSFQTAINNIRKDTILFLENDYLDISVYRRILLDESLNNNIGFTFDYSHAKLWSGNTFKEWIDFLQELKNQNIPIHIHVAHNSGVFDNHVSLKSSILNTIELLDYEEWSKSSMKEDFKILNDLLLDNDKILEVNPELQIEEFDFLLKI